MVSQYRLGKSQYLKRLLHIWHLLNAPCSEITESISRAQETELPFWERLAYKLHLLYCSACRRYVRHLEALRVALRRIAGELRDPSADAPVGPKLSAAARERIRRELRY